MLTLHVVSLPHTQTTSEFSWCAYTEKVRKFATMMTERGHTVYLYAGEGNEAKCAEHVMCLSPKEQAGLFKDRIPEFGAEQLGFVAFAARAVVEIHQRANPGDYLCLIGGHAQKPIADALAHLTTVEFGIGYEGTFCDYRVFESYAWQHVIYGAQQGAAGSNGKYYDTVIPNYFEVDQFPRGNGGGDYLLYVGRLTQRKGLEVVRLIAERTGRHLIVAGEGDTSLVPVGAEYVGNVGPEQRGELMSQARCVLTPTTYVEPFCGVAVEAQLCGTPAIATPWGAFTETIEQGKTGYRCHTLGAFCQAVEDCDTLDRTYIRDRAVARYSTQTVAPMYEDYFAQLDGLAGEGWYG